MSPDTVAVGVFSIAGTILGVLAGLLGERWLRSRGELLCVIGGVRYEPVWMGDGSTRSADEDLDQLPESGSNILEETLRVVWMFDLRFFNEKEEPTGLHAVSVAFVNGGGKTAIIGPMAAAVPGRTHQLRLREPGEPSDLINLPSQQWASMRVEGYVEGGSA